jgi:chromosomal replication initiator protein
MLERSPQAKVLYVTSERFTNEYIAAVRGQRMREFRETYRSVDMLLVDDIHFIAAKEGTQEEFFHTFNALHQANKQILISSDRPPKSIPDLEERLVTRFECGMLADVSSPDLETRIAILEEKCKEKNFLLDKEVLHYIASVIQSNVRELEGALNKVIAYHQFKNISPTLETTKPILSGFMPERRRGSITPKTLVESVANYYGIGVPDLLSQSRERKLSFPRQIAAYLLREELKSSFPAIGKELGGRDHTTAMHACSKISCALQTDTRLRQDIDRIREHLFGT